MTTWPDGIPFFDLRSGYGAQPGENTLRTPMDVGQAKVRRRTTSAPSIITGASYMTREEAQRFEQFWRDTLKDGALSFTLTDGLYRRRNLLVQSEDFSAGWAASAGLTRTDAISFIENATASRFTSAGASAKLLTQTAGQFSGGTETLAITVENATSAQFAAGIWNVTAGSWVVLATLTWATSTAVITVGTGTVNLTSLGTGPNGALARRMAVSGAGTSGNNRAAYIYPTGATVNTTAAIIHSAQLETGDAFTQYEPVGASYPATHVTRGGLKTYRIVGEPDSKPMGLGHRVSVVLEVEP